MTEQIANQFLSETSIASTDLQSAMKEIAVKETSQYSAGYLLCALESAHHRGNPALGPIGQNIMNKLDAWLLEKDASEKQNNDL